MNETSVRSEARPLEDQLEELVADLLARKKYQEIVKRLFARAQGEWGSVKELCAGCADTGGPWEGLDRLGAEDLLAVWLDYPGTHAREGQALLVFFYPESYWSKVAYYNRNTLPNTSAGNPGPAARESSTSAG